MDHIKQRLIEVAKPKIEALHALNSTHANHVIQEVTLGQVLSGMKGVVSLMTDTSKLDPEEGIRFRGYSIPQLRDLLPKNTTDRNNFV